MDVRTFIEAAMTALPRRSPGPTAARPPAAVAVRDHPRSYAERRRVADVARVSTERLLTGNMCVADEEHLTVARKDVAACATPITRQEFLESTRNEEEIQVWPNSRTRAFQVVLSDSVYAFGRAPTGC